MIVMLNLTPLEELIDELRLSLHRVTRVSEELHADEPISIGMRAVLEYLLVRPAHWFITREPVKTLVGHTDTFSGNSGN